VSESQGYCIVFGAGQGRLAYELSIRSQLALVGTEEDTNNVNSGRSILHGADLYGDRIVLHQGSLTNLSYSDYAGLLVVSDSVITNGVCYGSAAEMFRMVRPDGSVALIGQPTNCPNSLSRSDLTNWLEAASLSYTLTEDDNGLWARIDRGPVPGAGEWTHMWADSGNTGCSGDSLDASSRTVLWFGEPGPRAMVDRHAKAMPPMYKGGRLFVPGENRVICLDAYNGARLWDLEVEDSARLAMLRDAGWIAVADDYLYVAAQTNCFKVDVDTGEIAGTYQPPSDGRDWGYVAVVSNRLFGSEQITDASYIAPLGLGATSICRGFGRSIITSRSLFCRDRNTGALNWTYDEDEGLGSNEFVIANSSICVGDGVYFFESYAAAALASADGRVSPGDFTQGTNEYLVKLDKETGALQWRLQNEMPFVPAFYLSYAKPAGYPDGVLLASGSYRGDTNHVWYNLQAYHASDGSAAWSTNISTGSAEVNHGEGDKHPMIVGDTIHLRLGSYNLATGAPGGFTFRVSACSDCSASMNHIFARGSSSSALIHNIGAGYSPGQNLTSAQRPGCYINVIPVGGVMIMPPLNAGCTCGYTLQTTMTWIPE